MSRYYALVLVPEGTPKETACDAALDLLYPYMRTEQETAKDFKFDYMLDPEDIAALSDDESTQNIWPVREIIDRLAQLEVEAILTPDGTWHETQAGQLWDDESWLKRALCVLQQHRECL